MSLGIHFAFTFIVAKSTLFVGCSFVVITSSNLALFDPSFVPSSFTIARSEIRVTIACSEIKVTLQCSHQPFILAARPVAFSGCR